MKNEGELLVSKEAVKKVAIVNKWLKQNGFENFQSTSDHIYGVADSITDFNMKLLIGIVTPDHEFDIDQMMIKAYKSNRQIWLATVDTEKETIEWKSI